MKKTPITQQLYITQIEADSSALCTVLNDWHFHSLLFLNCKTNSYSETYTCA